jgi:hypothetical protein
VTSERRAVAFALCVLPFVALAALNAGGYRYGASDQAFYQPAVLLQLDPTLFPRDREVLGAQTHLTAADEAIALVARLTGAPLPVVFAGLYVLSLALFAWGAWSIGLQFYSRVWTTVALLAALTLRHAIARSGTNSLEGYFQPRLLAYALGAVAIAAFLRGRIGRTAVLVAMAAVVHPTTAVWFAVWLTAATALAYPSLRRWTAVAVVAGGGVAAWLLMGPLASRLVQMDAEWRQLLVTKTYLFPLEWPLYAWVFNLGYLGLIAWIYRRRRAAGRVDPRERGLVLGSVSLVIIFAGALVAQALGIALAFQLQPARVFWMFDFLAAVYVVWALAEDTGRLKPAPTVAVGSDDTGRLKPAPTEAVGSEPAPTQPAPTQPAPMAAAPTEAAQTRTDVGAGFSRPVALILIALSAIRGSYVVIDAERPPVQLEIADDDWGRVMAWARATDTRSGWLADPMHAVRYGTSVRVAGERDVLVEAVKDAALGMYDRRIAVRTDERVRAAAGFDALSAGEARRLAAQYDLDFMVTEQALDLPLAFTSGALRVYRLR